MLPAAAGPRYLEDVMAEVLARSVAISIPAEVEAVFREFRTCEFTTLARDGTPITWPMLPFWRPDTGQFMTTTSIGLPDKAFNIRRDPRVSLLFSDPTGSGLDNPPTVLVQGHAGITGIPAADHVRTRAHRVIEVARIRFDFCARVHHEIPVGELEEELRPRRR